MSKSLGERFRYFEEEKRTGGTADVYKGVDLQNAGRKIAVKFLRDLYISDSHTALAFEREQLALSKLAHPAIVELIDAGRDPETGSRFIVTEWLPHTLGEQLDKEDIDTWDGFYSIYGSEILDALKYAYSHEVTHRDLKPANILVDDHGAPKLIDFGIARFLEAPQIGHTMASFKTVPFCPPDNGGFDGGGGRDAWGFVSTCVALMSRRPLESYNDLRLAFEEVQWPKDIEDIFGQALADDPKQRYESVLDLAADIEAAQSKRSISARQQLRVPIAFTHAVLKPLQEFYPNASEQDLKDRYLSDLNSEAYLKFKRIDGPENSEVPPDIEILAGNEVFISSVDKNRGDCLILKGVRVLGSHWADQYRENAWRPYAKFTMRNPSDEDGTESIAELIDGLEVFERRHAALQTAKLDEEFFETWKNILRLKEEISRGEFSGIRFKNGELEGRRFHLRAQHDLAEELVGTRRAFEVSKAWFVRGEVESVERSQLTLYLDEDIESAPGTGILLHDDMAAKQAIQRQQAALDAIRYDRSASSRIRQVLVNPKGVSNVLETSIEQYKIGELDDDKKRATRIAIADNPMVLVQGPPGTGKTQLIVEIVFQVLSRNPAARILLTSQTHIALDNALERVLAVMPDIRAVRVGREQDERVSRAVQSLTLAEVAANWAKESEAQTMQYLEDFAAHWDISLEELQLSRAVASYRAALQAEERNAEYLTSMAETIKSLESALDSDQSSEPGRTALEKAEALTQLREDYSQGRRQARRLKKDIEQSQSELERTGPSGQQLLDLAIDELQEWEAVLAGSSDKQHQALRLIDLAQDWKLRFCQSEELYPVVLADSQIVAGTCVGFAGAKGILDVEFDFCVVDEASKATASEVCVPLSRSNRAILVGDHKQLPPFMESEMLDQERLEKFSLSRGDLDETLFERLHRDLPDDAKVLLSTQYRMVPEIGDLISECFYDNELESDDRSVRFDLSLAGIERPVTWMDTSGISGRFEQPCNPGFKNVLEAQQIGRLLQRINFSLSNFEEDLRVAVLTGYLMQQSELNRQIDRVEADIDKFAIECGSVDSFQGRQADISIFSVTRSNQAGSVGFLKEFRRLNVALSRSKDYLIIVGDFAFARSLGAESPIGRVAAYVQDNPGTCSMKVIEE